jgi:RHS repeat-associated protein
VLNLGSSNYITNIAGEVSQHSEYFAFGETFVEEHKGSNNSPYKFNGKELDNESGLYYYGARYYDPRISIWASVDPLAEKFPNMSPYAFCNNNPIRFIDPTGMSTEDPIDPPKPGTGTSTGNAQGVIPAGQPNAGAPNGVDLPATQLAEVVINSKPKSNTSNLFQLDYNKLPSSGAYGPSTDPKDLALVYSIILSPIAATMELSVLATAGVGIGLNSLSQYIANGGTAGDINMIEAGMSGIPAIGKIPYLSKLAPTVIGETVSWTPNSSWELPSSPAKWGAQLGGGVLSLGFGKVTDSHLAGEKGSEMIGGYFKFLIETGSNAAPNAVK